MTPLPSLTASALEDSVDILLASVKGEWQYGVIFCHQNFIKHWVGWIGTSSLYQHIHTHTRTHTHTYTHIHTHTPQPTLILLHCRVLAMVLAMREVSYVERNQVREYPSSHTMHACIALSLTGSDCQWDAKWLHSATRCNLGGWIKEETNNTCEHFCIQGIVRTTHTTDWKGDGTDSMDYTYETQGLCVV